MRINLRQPKFRKRFKTGQYVRDEFGLVYRVNHAVPISRIEFVCVSMVYTRQCGERDFSHALTSAKNLTYMRGIGKK